MEQHFTMNDNDRVAVLITALIGFLGIFGAMGGCRLEQEINKLEKQNQEIIGRLQKIEDK